MIGGGEYAELRAFIMIAETRSFREAAGRLGVTPSALSRTIKRLEGRLGHRLLNRTTRSVSPTEAGQSLYARLLPAVASLEEAVDDTLARRGDAKGTVRLNLPRLAAEVLLMPRLAEFSALHPGIHLDIVMDDALSDVIGRGFDAGIRPQELLEKDMIAVRLTPPFRNAVVGTPGYFAVHDVPQSPQDLKRHLCINYRWADSRQPYRWPFDGPDGPFEINVEGPFSVNDTGLLKDAALSGTGLACLSEPMVAPHVARGELVEVLEPWCKQYAGFFLYHPSRRQTPLALRALITFLTESQARRGAVAPAP
ncbi:LysR family transcriptional regulator [Pseudoroseicyclus aestuarii]|uniref:LysR family transcriptional regulator n=2 Tax=Pseudoroseicyclus aestuarii TaxID=1795041 RepID=A0A318SP20_9RHOB|nr:LysR family transcriptional regulator [Pseudoroseicyclus aestuarii]